MNASQRFGATLIAMVGEEELDELMNWNMDEHLWIYNPDEWGLDDDDEHQARTDYASEILF